MRSPIGDEFKFSKSECCDDTLVDYESNVDVLADKLKAVHELVQKANKL
jgi:hypothetical protein